MGTLTLTEIPEGDDQAGHAQAQADLFVSVHANYSNSTNARGVETYYSNFFAAPGSKEIEKRTLYTILSRPVHRWEFIAGKFLGLAGTLTVNTVCMAAGVFAAVMSPWYFLMMP